MLLSVIAERGTLQPPAPAQVPPRLPPQVAYQRLDSLERVALTAATFNERLHATSTIARPGMPDRGDCQRSAGNSPSEIRYPGIVGRLARVFRHSHDSDLRGAILGLMRMQAECAEVIAFFSEVAQEPSPPLTPDVVVLNDDPSRSLQAVAVGALSRMGLEGETALRRLHAQGTVTDPYGREELERLARQGFRQPPKK